MQHCIANPDVECDKSMQYSSAITAVMTGETAATVKPMGIKPVNVKLNEKWGGREAGEASGWQKAMGLKADIEDLSEACSECLRAVVRPEVDLVWGLEAEFGLTV